MNHLDMKVFEIFRYSSGHVDFVLHLGGLFIWFGSACGKFRISIDYVRKFTIIRCGEKMSVGAKKWGKCLGCGEEAWLFEYEGTYNDPNDLMCESCIDEFHARVYEAEDAMAEGMDAFEENEEYWDEGFLDDCEEYY